MLDKETSYGITLLPIFLNCYLNYVLHHFINDQSQFINDQMDRISRSYQIFIQ